MADRQRLREPTESTAAEQAPASNGTDTLLWMALILAVVLNVVLTTIGLGLLGFPFGLVATFCTVTLVVRYVQRRR